MQRGPEVRTSSTVSSELSSRYTLGNECMSCLMEGSCVAMRSSSSYSQTTQHPMSGKTLQMPDSSDFLPHEKR